MRGKAQQPRPLQDPLLWGNYNVAYTSTRRSKDQQGDPAGGRFRNSIGRALFQTTGLYQSCIAPDVVTNKVSFRLFGFINGYVGLRGKVIPVDDETVVSVRAMHECMVLLLGMQYSHACAPMHSNQKPLRTGMGDGMCADACMDRARSHYRLCALPWLGWCT